MQHKSLSILFSKCFFKAVLNSGYQVRLAYQYELFTLSDKVSGELKELYTKFSLLDFRKQILVCKELRASWHLESKVRWHALCECCCPPSCLLAELAAHSCWIFSFSLLSVAPLLYIALLDATTERTVQNSGRTHWGIGKCQSHLDRRKLTPSLVLQQIIAF